MSSPIKFDPDQVWLAMLGQIAAGASLSAIVRLPGMPSYSWCKLQLRENPELRRQYEQAVEDRADVLAEMIEAIADEEIPADLDGPGKSAFIQRQRLRVDARKWASSKLAPRRYGDQIKVEVATTTVNLRAILDERDRRIQELTIADAITIDHNTP